MRIARALGALLLLALLLFGAPLALAALGGPGYLLTVDWGNALVSTGNSRLILALLSLVGWLAWLAVALTVVFELVAVLSRQRITLRLPGTGWLRPFIGSLVVAAVTLPGLAHADEAAPPVVVAPLTPQVQAAAPSEAPAPDATTPDAPTRRYTVQVGDELWTVAEQQLGSGERWREIAALTPGLGDSLRLTPGEVILLPADAGPQPAAEPPPSVVVVVERNDSLWRIAERTLGDGERWGEIYNLNRDQIADPDEIDVGWVLRLPDPPPGAATAPPPTTGTAPQTPPAQPVGSGAAISATITAVDGAAGHLPAPEPLPIQPSIEASNQATPTVAPSAPAAPADPQRASVEATSDQAEEGPNLAALLGPIGALLAAGLVAGVATRRRTQLLARALGRRVIPAPEQVTRFWGALASHSESAAAAPTTAATTVVLGWNADGEAVVADVEHERSLIFDGGEATAAVSSVITTLSSAPWAESVELVLVGNADWARALDDPRITSLETAAEGLTELARRCSQRRIAMRSATLPQLREQPDLAASWVPIVYVFETPLSATQLDAIADALALGEVGVSVVGPAPTPSHIAGAAVHVEADEASWGVLRFTPQLVTEPARRVLVDLFGSANTTETEPAPWWCDPEASVSGSALSPLPSNVLPLPRHEAHPEERLMPEPPDAIHPTLLLLGEVDLQGTAGEPPQRALAQCMEYCAWLLSNPGATPTVMVQDLLVAETTRRSNMSRLRTWLGSDEEGAQYLPDAYSGRISLDERVSSDWERFEALLAGGVNGASSAALRQALRLVRGVPLGSLGFQWHWAQTLRTDMVSMIVDAACVLADRAIDHEDVDTALWAVGRGRLAAPESDLLSTREIHALAVAHRQPQLDRAILTLNRSVRADGRDLDPELARRVQLAIHLSSRAAQAGES